MTKFTAFLLAGIVFLGVFTGFSKTVKRGALKSVDFDVTVRIQDKISQRFDELMDDGAVLADGIVSSVITLAITGLLLVDRKKKSAQGGSALGRKIRWGALVIPVMFVLFLAVEVYGKNMLPHPGPPFFMLKQPTTIFPKFHVAQPFSYPSGHAGRSTFLAVVVGIVVLQKFAKKKEKAILLLGVIFGYTIFVWVSRIYLGHHWFSDIVGGILLGGGCGMIAASFLIDSKK